MSRPPPPSGSALPVAPRALPPRRWCCWSPRVTEFSLDFPVPWGEPRARAVFRAQAADFVVHEHLGWEPCGSGEHLLLQVEKERENTGWVAREIAALAGVRETDIGYCGL